MTTTYKKARLRAKLKLADASEIIGIDEKDLGRIEKGIVKPNLFILKRMAYKYRVTTDYLLEVQL
ncbi:Helix-turn-helix domain protein [Fructobacillus sp. EFB-N1]|nr:helix-turn-helix transcriptional regulator [Fructobacillus sp. EFB-N1]KMK52617.1 Helix-turn-helix domain protein [Fructobacillus sp. EFB-N1]